MTKTELLKFKYNAAINMLRLLNGQQAVDMLEREISVNLTNMRLATKTQEEWDNFIDYEGD